MLDSLEFMQLLLSTDFRMSQYQSSCFKKGIKNQCQSGNLLISVKEASLQQQHFYPFGILQNNNNCQTFTKRLPFHASSTSSSTDNLPVSRLSLGYGVPVGIYSLEVTWPSGLGHWCCNLEVLFTGGQGVLPCIGHIGMCGPKGYCFLAVLVINRVSILADFGHFVHKCRVWFLHSNLHLSILRSHSFIIITKRKSTKALHKLCLW